jgi:predicted exporter/predicted hotdog family 3-hydroxylacyl-ACP dehydratase
MKFTRQALALLAVWVAALAIAGLYVDRGLAIGTDLRLFLPAPTTREQKLLLDEIGEGPGSRALVIALSGTTPEALADASRALQSALAPKNEFRLVTNGEIALDSVPESWLPYRFLLSRTLDTQPLDAATLHRELETRARDLASPAGGFLEPWLPRDPTLEALQLLEQWQPMQEPHRLYDVWFDAAGTRALLIAETRAPAFDPDRQRAALEVLNAAFTDVKGSSPIAMQVSGAGTFSVLMEGRTRGEATMLGTAATVGMVVLLLIAYRRFGAVLLSALPLASAGLAGLAAVSALFGTVHGITLAFGFTLIGVAQDYPMHLLSHEHEGRSPLEIVRELWPTLMTGVASTCIAYGTFLFSGVTGLEQLACFTVTSLAVAGATTRWLLPRLIAPAGRDHGDSRILASIWTAMSHLPSPGWLAPALVAICLGVIALGRVPFWENDLAKLTPVPVELLEQDQALRSELGSPDLRYLLVVDAATPDAALTRLGELDATLRALVERGAITGYDHAGRYLATSAAQRARQQQLPDAATLRAALATAIAGTPFRPDVFEPFLDDVEKARTLPPLTFDELRKSPLGSSIEILLVPRGEHTSALVTLNGVKDPDAIAALARSQSQDVTLLDLKDASETLVAHQRTRILWSLAIAVVLLIGVIAWSLRKASRVYRVMAPMVITTLVIIATLSAVGTSLTLFHLIALILAAGLGLDYALFFEHASSDPLEQRRTLHAILVCSLSTLMVFALLALSTLPVLRAIGLTVTIGVISNFVLAMLLTREKTGDWALGTGQSVLPEPSAQSPVPIESLIPHQGTMCLLERVVEWNAERIRLATSTHRSKTNPLRNDDRLRAIHLCEYGAQAMAVHGALLAESRGEKNSPGMLVSLRDVALTRDYIDDLNGELQVLATCLQANESSLQYRFRVEHAGVVLAEGRAAVVLDPRLTAVG